ncbi:molybdopterin-dependent oxidoreductase [Stetteria hydrogenophila]
MRLNRREFLKLASLTAAAASMPMGELILERRKADAGAAVEKLQAVGVGGTRVARLACTICVKCPLVVEVEKKNGAERVKSIRFNYIKGLEGEYATCGRPQTIFEARHLEQRIKKPLKRVGERGSGQFEEISWEEALDLIAEKLKQYAPDEIVVFRHVIPEGNVVTYFFQKVLGIPNITNHADTCHPAFNHGIWWISGKSMGPAAVVADYPNAKLAVFMGRNPTDAIVATSWDKRFAEGRRRGLRVIAFDIRKSRLTQLADRYFIIPPATDLAILLAVTHTLIKEGWYNEDYLRKYTNAPMLVYPDTLEPVGLLDHPKWKGKKDYLVLDEADGKVKPKTQAEKPALRATVEVNGRKAITVLDLVWEAVKNYTPEWAEGITGVKAEDIVWFARELAENAPRAFIHPGYKTARYANEAMKTRMIFIVNALLGAIGAKGGIVWPRKVKLKNPMSILGIKGSGPKAPPLYKYWEEQGVKFIIEESYSQLAIKSILEEKPKKIKMIIVINENVLGHSQGVKEVAEAFKKADFVVVADNVFNETTMYADLVLPVSMFFEYAAPTLITPSKTAVGQVIVHEKALDPPPGVDAKPAWWIVKELGKRLDPANADKYEKLADYEYIWRKQAEAAGIDYEELKKYGTTAIADSPIYHPLKGKFLPSVTGEIELVSVKGMEQFKDYAWKPSILNPLPAWVPPRWMQLKGGAKLADNEFVAVDFYHKMHVHNMWLRYTKLTQSTMVWEGWNYVNINRERGEKLGLRDGDTIKIIGPGGTITARVRLTDDVHPFVAMAPHGTNFGYIPNKVTIKYRDGRTETITLLPEVYAGLNTGMVYSFKDILLYEEGGGTAFDDGVVRIEKA